MDPICALDGLNIQIAKEMVLKIDFQSLAEAFAAYVDLWSMLPFTSAISSIFAGIPGEQLCGNCWKELGNARPRH